MRQATPSIHYWRRLNAVLTAAGAPPLTYHEALALFLSSMSIEAAAALLRRARLAN